MSYTEERAALFNDYASTLFEEYAAAYQEKETIYLRGTRLLRIRVLNNLVEMMNKQLKEKMDHLLQECKQKAEAQHGDLQARLNTIYHEHIVRFRHQYFDLPSDQT